MKKCKSKEDEKKRQMTYVTTMQNEYGKTIAFERRNCLLVETCIKSLVKLYRKMCEYKLIKNELAQVKK